MNIRPIGEDEAKCISFKDIEWKQEEEPQLVEFVFYGSSNVRYHEEKTEEIQKWKDLDVYEEVENVGQPWITCRWVCTEKLKGGKLFRKARLCIRGCEEVNAQSKTDSPTCQKESLRLLLTIISAKHWDLCSMDIKSAYLQGVPLNREIYIMPPKEAKTEKLWRLKKCVYGLSDAGRHWYIKVTQELKTLGGKQSDQDQAVFTWYNSDNCIGIMAIHVDDFIYGGTELFKETVISKLRSTFKVGLEESNGLKYLGITLNQTMLGINMSTDAYCSSLVEIKDIHLDSTHRLNQSETQCLRHLSGQINWIATQSRPDLSYDNCIIGNSITNATHKEIKQLNKCVRKAKLNCLCLTYPSSFDIENCLIVGFTDASFGNLPDGGSQGAYLIFLCDKYGHTVLVSWQSRRIRRTVTSTLAAECIAAVEASEACYHLQTLTHTILRRDRQGIPIKIMCDNRSLVDAVHSSTAVQNKRLQIEISVLREMIKRSEIEEFRWVPTDIQVANSLTKAGCSNKLLYQILNGHKKFCVQSGKFE